MADDGWQTVGAGGSIVPAKTAQPAAGTSSKKKKKKKKKASVAESGGGAGSPADAAPIAVEEKLPRVPVENEWETVVDTKKKKYEERRLRKMTEEQRAAEEKAKKDAELMKRLEKTNGGPPKPKKRRNKIANPDEPRIAVPTSKSGQKKKNKSNTSKKPKSPEEIIKVVSSILEASPTDYLTVAAIGDRLQALTNVSWNKHYKPSHGSLSKFVGSKPQFHVDESGNVYLQSRYDRVMARKEDVRRQKQQRREAKANGGHKHSGRARSSSSPAAPSSGGASVGTAVVVLVLVLCLTLLASTGFDVNAAIQRVLGVFSS